MNEYTLILKDMIFHSGILEDYVNLAIQKITKGVAKSKVIKTIATYIYYDTIEDIRKISEDAEKQVDIKAVAGVIYATAIAIRETCPNG